ncbi:MAG TPA: NADH-quinone oxidoreductase subunit NuoH [Verrucomicrobiae bacterium]|nr:NADH-quinone oxidoreductase subunit NuoH [Verrucomicrobiae bacterium]
MAHRLSGAAPAPVQPIMLAALIIAALMTAFGSCFALTTIMERKILGRMQNRLGPNRVGPCGLLQPMADAVKMLIKEDLVPDAADRTLHALAPLVLTVPIWLAFAVLPFGRNMVAVNFDAGILFFFAIGGASELAVFMAGWSSQNKYSLIGAMRGIAQMISYEVPLVLSTVTALMMAGSLSLVAIVDAQSGYAFGWLARWHVFTPWGLAGFGLFLIAAAAESNRSPFDLPEGESEIIAGYLTEYSGFKYALFFLGEYLGLFAVTGLGVTLFLGGWQPPVKALAGTPSWFWFAAKFAALIFLFIWVRATLPRLRLDQLLNFSWRFLVPLGLVNLLAAAVWSWTRPWQFPGSMGVRWLIGGSILALFYCWLGRGLRPDARPARQYHYAA